MEYVKLGEIATITNGKRNAQDALENGEYPLFDRSTIVKKSDKFLFDKEAIIVPGEGRQFIPKYYNGKFDLHQRCYAIFDFYDKLNAKFLYYFIYWNQDYFQSVYTGSTVPSLRLGNFTNMLIPNYEKSQQQKIAAHLDKITEAINNKKKQLALFDELVKSKFVEMFGDPVTNEMGWECKKVIDVVTLQRGYDLPVQNRNEFGNVPVWGSNGILGNHDVAKIDKGIITGRSGTIGEVYYSETPFWPLNTTLFSNDTHGNNIIYLKHLLTFYNLKRFASGAGVPTLNRNEFHDNPIIDVPLPLQNQFANFVQKCDRTKSTVKQEIACLQELLDSKMQDFFGNV